MAYKSILIVGDHAEGLVLDLLVAAGYERANTKDSTGLLKE